MGWDEAFLQKAVNTCTNPSGKIEDCPLFDVVDEAKATSCGLQLPLPQLLFSENVKGPVAKLPGNVEVGGGSGDKGSGHVPSAAPVPTLPYAPGERPSNPAAPLPGQIFKDKSSPPAAAPATSTSAVAYAAAATPVVQPTTPPPPPPATTPAPETKSYYSTQYITSGNVVSKILWEEQFVYVTTTVQAPAGAAGRRRRRAAHMHGHGHGKLLH